MTPPRNPLRQEKPRCAKCGEASVSNPACYFCARNPPAFLVGSMPICAGCAEYHEIKQAEPVPEAAHYHEPKSYGGWWPVAGAKEDE